VSAVNLSLTKRDEKTFYAELELAHGNSRIKVDCRPSDGIAVAIRLGIPILAAPALDPEFEAA
jgi:bifunctional DNase/RNase